MFAAIKSLWGSIFEQSRRQWLTLLLVYVPPTIFLLILTMQRDVPAHDLMADTASITNVPTYIGLVSNLGILVWGATVTICVFTMALLGRQSSWFSFFAGSAGLTLLLLLDDQFMIHDRVLPHNNIPEVVYIAFYGLVCLAYTVAFWRFFRQTDYVLLLIAVALLGFSVAVDVAGDRIQDIYYALRGVNSMVADEAAVSVEGFASTEPESPRLTDVDDASSEAGNSWIPDGNLSQLAEDGSKFLGIIGWLLYFASVARQCVLHRMRAGLQPETMLLTPEG
jgi:hypothetical protein